MPRSRRWLNTITWAKRQTQQSLHRRLDPVSASVPLRASYTGLFARGMGRDLRISVEEMVG